MRSVAFIHVSGRRLEDELVPVRKLAGAVLRAAAQTHRRPVAPGREPRGRLLQPQRRVRRRLPPGVLLAAPGGPAVPAAPVRGPRARPRPPAHHGRLHAAPAAAAGRRDAPAPRQPGRAEPRHDEPQPQLQVRRLDVVHERGLPAGPEHQEHPAAGDKPGRERRRGVRRDGGVEEFRGDVAALGEHVAGGEVGRGRGDGIAELVVAGVEHQLHVQQREAGLEHQQQRRIHAEPTADLPLDEEGAPRPK